MYEQAEHPENNPALHVELPRNFEDQFESRSSSVHQAIAYGLSIPVVTFLAAGAILLFSRGFGGPRCTAGLATWLCSQSLSILFVVVTMAISFGGVVGCALVVWLRFRRYQHWSPWLACLWGLIPFSLFWAAGALALL
ncbi:MAG: hypothetical protein Q3972_04885 [Corynebacterium sp.]|nr:hypothetical protein [Corynebacterium sp.]